MLPVGWRFYPMEGTMRKSAKKRTGSKKGRGAKKPKATRKRNGLRRAARIAFRQGGED
jgi:hypothetical protein